MRFAIPHMLWFLALVPLVAVYLLWASGYRHDLMRRFGTEKALFRARLVMSGAIHWIRMGLYVLGMLALVLALARPQWGFHERRIISRGVDMMIAIDTSASMMARDFPPTRLSRAKELLKNLIWEAKGSRVGVVAFAGGAVVMCPLTLDYNMASTALKAVDVNTVSSQGTNIASAIHAGLEGFKISGGNDRVLIVLTDGEQTERLDDLDNEINQAVEQGVKIFAIGIGSTQGSTILTSRGPKRDAQGNVVNTKLDFAKLQEIAEKTKGVAIKAEKIGASEIADISARLSQFKGQKQQDKSVRVYHDRYPWFLAVAAACFLLEALLRNFYGLKWGRRKATVASVALFGAGFLVTPQLACAYPGEAFVRAREAYQKFNAGDYDQSLALYKRASELSPDDAQILYNMGAAATKANKLEDARKAFRSVYDPENPGLNAEALFAATTLDHQDVRETIRSKRETWVQDLAGMGEAAENAKKEIQDTIGKLKPILSDYKKAIISKDSDRDMKTNFEIAKSELEDLEKLLEDKRQQEQQQQEQQPQDNKEEKDQQKQDNQKNQQGQDQSDKDQKGQDKEQPGDKGQQDGQDKPENQNKPGEDKQQTPTPQDKGKDQQDQKGEGQKEQQPEDKLGDDKGKEQQPDEKGKPTPTPTPSPTPTGTPGSGEGTGQPGPAPQGTPVPIGEMSPTDVDRLLNTLPPEDQQALQIMFGAGQQKQEDMKNDW